MTGSGVLVARLLAMLLAASALFAGNEIPAVAAAQSGRWHPRPTVAAWQFQLQGPIDTSVRAAVYEVDGFDTPRATVAHLHAMGRKVICYLDVGSWESYRPDAREFPAAVLGRAYAGYPQERWLDIRHYQRFAAVLEARISMCAAKHFDAVEADNVNGWENPTGFPITAGDQVRFNRWIAGEVHKRGMSVGLKNDGAQVRALLPYFDFAVVEQCFQYQECGQYRPFITAGKAVFEVEYQRPRSAFCTLARHIAFASIAKQDTLYARPWAPCVAS